MSRLVIASGNPGKLVEFTALLEPLGFEPVSQRALGIDDAEEPHPTFVENALAKARHAALLSGLPALADDSGLCVDALNGQPGVRSARYAESLDGTFECAAADRATQDARNNAKLLAALDGRTDRGARYVCALVFVRHAGDPEPIVAMGHWSGVIGEVARGVHGFGYDPLFLLPDRGLTVAELGLEIKNGISHRATALGRLANELRNR